MLTRKGKRSRRSTAPRKTQIDGEKFSVLDVQSRKASKSSKDDCKLPPDTVGKSKEYRVILSDSEDKDIDKGSAASLESYSIIAINRHSNNPSDFELVETGPVAIGYLSTGSRILHLNFKAKKKGVSDVQTFFSELAETEMNDVRADKVVCMGPSDLLPEKADTRGCHYCYSHNIHHPEYSLSFRNGGENHWKTLCSKINEVHDYLWKSMRRRKHKKDVGLSLEFSDPGLEYVGDTCDDSTDRCASVALSLFNGEQGSNFELVKIGGVVDVVGSIGFILHINFEAKNKEEPGVEVKTFFAEVIHCGNFFLVDFCKCLGPSNHLPDEADLRGCCFCKANIHHPLGPGYLIGRELGSRSFECES